MEKSKDFGKMVKNLRREAGITQKELAEKVNLDHTYISKIENQNTPYSPSVRTIRKIARELEVHPIRLLKSAGKLSELEDLTGSERAINFLLKADETLKNSSDWEKLEESLIEIKRGED